MRNDNKTKTTSMDRAGGEDSGGGAISTADSNTAVNRIIDGHCPACDKDVDPAIQGIKCWFCYNYFHVINCAEENLSVAASSSFNNHLKSAVTNTGVYEKRFGRFLFACDYCLTLEEEKRCASSVDRVELLDKKIEALNNTFVSELADLKKLIVQPSALSTSPGNENTVTSSNPWNDKQRTENLKHTMAIGKDENGNSVNLEAVEKLCVDNGIPVHKTFDLKKSQGTGIVLNNKLDADRLKEKLSNDLPRHKVENVATIKPAISDVGLKWEYSKEELTEMIKKQNPGITSLFESTVTSGDDKCLDILAIKPLKNNCEIYKAIIRVSNVIRSVISKQGDRLYIGFQSSCKVYDNIFVLRCYKCQEYNHHSKECKNQAVCGFCAGGHETRNCSEKSNVHGAKCVNCTKAGKTGSDTSHEAGSLDCHVYKQQYHKVKNSIPFHQGK